MIEHQNTTLNTQEKNSKSNGYSYSYSYYYYIELFCPSATEMKQTLKKMGNYHLDHHDDQTESLGASPLMVGWASRWWSWAEGLVSMRGRSLASSSSSGSVVLRLMQEHLSREAKKADATLTPTQLATRSSFSHDMKLQLLLLGFVVVVVVVVVLSISDLFFSFFLLSCWWRRRLVLEIARI